MNDQASLSYAAPFVELLRKFVDPRIISGAAGLSARIMRRLTEKVRVRRTLA